ncbi:1,3-beta-galactosyl-N-acetylhexosamine phosphorylase [Paenibacillus odorifer]|nr:1,3-beta-galactosyl-N-acetylhexosamine phosphorylase [Paenibacillus odorifer]
MEGSYVDKGRFTLPGETGMEEVIADLVERWGVDAVRDSDGTNLSQDILDMGLQIYSTLCLVREDNEWAKQHPQYRQQIYLMSAPVIVTSKVKAIDIMADYFAEQFIPNTDVDIKKYWQVVNRTTGEVLPSECWSYAEGIVTLEQAVQFHKYTVSFLAYQKWEPVSMYNHITNDWDEEHRLPLDVRYPEAQGHVLKVLEDWLKKHPKTDIVRFTTFFYNFDLIFNKEGKEKQVNWFGYLSCVSPLALEQFEQAYGYRLTAEDFVDQGRYNTPFKNPTQRYLDWMDFNQKFIAGYAKQCVEMVHDFGKKAIMFFGDHWAGTEPYGKYFPEIGLDAVVGAAGDGVTTRMIADIPIKDTEARFYPYFFPDVFFEGGDPVGESMPIWIKCRRALMRKPVGRMGYGGYLSLAHQFPDFIDHVTEIAMQFKGIHANAEGTQPFKAPFKVAVLNTWGSLRSWQTHQVAHSLWNQRCYSYIGALESLAGLPFDIEFISFDDIRLSGIDPSIGVIINAGDVHTSWSGGDQWSDPQVVATLREWVEQGGGFIGIGDPSAYEHQGVLFQLADILGVQKEIGFTASINKPKVTPVQGHFITEDLEGEINYGEGMTMIYQAEAGAEILDVHQGSCNLAVNSFGQGRGVYIAGLPYSIQNTRLLSRAIFWAAHQEEQLYSWFSVNPNVECHAYPETGRYCAVNNTSEIQKTTILMDNAVIQEIELGGMESVWFQFEIIH